MNFSLECILFVFTVISLLSQLVSADLCPGTNLKCPYPQSCCSAGCCIPTEFQEAYRIVRWGIWNMWYFWFVLIFIVLTCFGACGYWRRRRWVDTRTASSLRLGTTRQHRPSNWHRSEQRSMRVAMTVVLSPTCPCDVNSTLPCNDADSCLYDSEHSKPPPAYIEIMTHPEQFPRRSTERNFFSGQDALPPYPGLPNITV